MILRQRRCHSADLFQSILSYFPSGTMWRLSESAGQCRVKRQRQDNPSSLFLSLPLSLSHKRCLSVSMCLCLTFFMWIVKIKKQFTFPFSSLSLILTFPAHLCPLFSVCMRYICARVCTRVLVTCSSDHFEYKLSELLLLLLLFNCGHLFLTNIFYVSEITTNWNPTKTSACLSVFVNSSS